MWTQHDTEEEQKGRLKIKVSRSIETATCFLEQEL